MSARKYTFMERDGGQWAPIEGGEQLVCCCDCGLGHLYEYRIKHGKIEQRVSRHRRAPHAKAQVS
jgi:hypothetical protein